MPVDWQQAMAAGHVVAATAALCVGAAVLGLRKGTRVHRGLGGVYSLALVLTDVAALSLHREAAFGVFHLLAVVSLATLAVALVPLVAGRRSPRVMATHAYCMAWSYVGLVAAGSGQLAATREDAGRLVPAVIAAVLAAGAVTLSWRMPATLDRIGVPGPARGGVLSARD